MSLLKFGRLGCDCAGKDWALPNRHRVGAREEQPKPHGI